MTAKTVTIRSRVDSGSWTCLGCGVLHIGRRPADDMCRECLVLAMTADAGDE